MWGILRTCIYRVVWYVNVSLMSLILVPYLQDWGLLYTLWNQCLDQPRHLDFLSFCSDFCQCNGVPFSLARAMCWASKGSALGLLAVCLYQFKGKKQTNKHLSELQWWFHNVEKADSLLRTPNAKVCITLYTLHTRVRVLWVMGIEKIGGRRTEAEPKSRPVAEVFGRVFVLNIY